MDIDVIDGLTQDDAMNTDRRILSGEIGVDTVDDMVDKILLKLGHVNGCPCLCHSRIRRLRIFGHGDAGEQGLGNSQQASGTHATDRLLTVESGRLLHRDKLQELAGEFQPDGWVELRGCSVASDSTGGELLQKLANLWRVPVKAGLPLQPAGRGFEGTVVVAWPNRSDLEFREPRRPAPRPRPRPLNHWQTR